MSGGRRSGGRGRRPNRQRNARHQQKGPQTPDDERLWRRVTQRFEENDWQRTWSPEDLVMFIVEQEGLAAQHRGDPKAERALLSKVNEAMALGRKTGAHIVPDEGKTVRFRTPASIDAIERNVGAWKDFFSRHGGRGGAPLAGRPGLTEENSSEADAATYRRLLQAWRSLLMHEPWPANISLNEDGVTAWQGLT